MSLPVSRSVCISISTFNLYTCLYLICISMALGPVLNRVHDVCTLGSQSFQTAGWPSSPRSLSRARGKNLYLAMHTYLYQSISVFIYIYIYIHTQIHTYVCMKRWTSTHRSNAVTAPAAPMPMSKQLDCASTTYSRVNPTLGQAPVQEFDQAKPDVLEAAVSLPPKRGWDCCPLQVCMFPGGLPTEESEESPDNFARYRRRMPRVHTLPAEMTPGRSL